MKTNITAKIHFEITKKIIQLKTNNIFIITQKL